MKSKFITVLIILAVLVLAGIFLFQDKAKEELPEQVDSYSGYKNYSSNKWDFEIKYPSDWSQEVLQENDKEFSVGFVNSSGSDSAENIIVYALTAKAQDFDELMDIGIAEISADENRTLIETRKTSLSGYPAYVLEYSNTDYTVEFKYLHYFINAEDNWYQLLYTAETSIYEDHLNVVEKIINSFIAQ